jgi:Rnl2 family RNA ligase
MRFRAFEKIPAEGRSSDTIRPAGRWIALEKIHGAQFVVGIGPQQVCFGKRKAWLADDEPFFGWQMLRADLMHVAHLLSAELPGAMLWVYGELYGGAYPHPAVPSWPGLSPVQTGVWYTPGLAYAVFDVLLAANQEEEGELLAHSEVMALAARVGLRTPPVLGRGNWAEVAAVKTRFASLVHKMHALPTLHNNWAEGVVLKPDQRSVPRLRTVYKRKISEFSEIRFGEAQPFDPHQTLALDELCAWAERLINPPRLASARSKVGPADRQGLVDEVTLDVLVDLSELFPSALSALTTDQQTQLEDHIRRCLSHGTA